MLWYILRNITLQKQTLNIYIIQSTLMINNIGYMFLIFSFFFLRQQTVFEKFCHFCLEFLIIEIVFNAKFNRKLNNLSNESHINLC